MKLHFSAVSIVSSSCSSAAFSGSKYASSPFRRFLPLYHSQCRNLEAQISHGLFRLLGSRHCRVYFTLPLAFGCLLGLLRFEFFKRMLRNLGSHLLKWCRIVIPGSYVLLCRFLWLFHNILRFQSVVFEWNFVGVSQNVVKIKVNIKFITRFVIKINVEEGTFPFLDTFASKITTSTDFVWYSTPKQRTAYSGSNVLQGTETLTPKKSFENFDGSSMQMFNLYKIKNEWEIWYRCYENYYRSYSEDIHNRVSHFSI